MSETIDARTPASTQVTITNTLAGLPWWLLIILLGGIFMVTAFYTDETYQAIFDFLKSGLIVTIRVTIIAYAQVTEEEARRLQPVLLRVDPKNRSLTGA